MGDLARTIRWAKHCQRLRAELARVEAAHASTHEKLVVALTRADQLEAERDAANDALFRCLEVSGEDLDGNGLATIPLRGVAC